MPAQTKIININTACAKEVAKVLKDKKLLNESKTKPSFVAYTSDNTSEFKLHSNTFCNISFDKVQKINLN